MTIEDKIYEHFRNEEFTWSIKNKGSVLPSSQDIENALDEAARMLYSEPIGTRLEVGRLIIEKRPRGHDVYMLVGNYE